MLLNRTIFRGGKLTKLEKEETIWKAEVFVKTKFTSSKMIFSVCKSKIKIAILLAVKIVEA